MLFGEAADCLQHVQREPDRDRPLWALRGTHRTILHYWWFYEYHATLWDFWLKPPHASHMPHPWLKHSGLRRAKALFCQRGRDENCTGRLAGILPLGSGMSVVLCYHQPVAPPFSARGSEGCVCYQQMRLTHINTVIAESIAEYRSPGNPHPSP